MDNTGIVVYANELFAGMLGYTAAELKGIALPELLPPPYGVLHTNAWLRRTGTMTGGKAPCMNNKTVKFLCKASDGLLLPLPRRAPAAQGPLWLDGLLLAPSLLPQGNDWRFAYATMRLQTDDDGGTDGGKHHDGGDKASISAAGFALNGPEARCCGSSGFVPKGKTEALAWHRVVWPAVPRCVDGASPTRTATRSLWSRLAARATPSPTGTC